MFPSYILAKLYIQGSLKNTATGFELKLKNSLDSATLVGLGPLKVDDAAFNPDACKVKIGEVVKNGSEITRQSPLPVRVNREIEMQIEAAPLAAGPHKVAFQIYTQEIGLVQFSITDKIAE